MQLNTAKLCMLAEDDKQYMVVYAEYSNHLYLVSQKKTLHFHQIQTCSLVKLFDIEKDNYCKNPRTHPAQLDRKVC